MEPIHDRPSAGAASVELVIQNGRLKGTARPISQPLTLIGRSGDCDLRLNVDGIHALHCLLAETPQGLMLRDLSGDGSISVNGRPAAVSELRDGDRLVIGPFQFLVRQSGASLADQLAEARNQHGLEKETLRIQAAAVAAQQAALLEEEARLQQRRAALEQQEEQLAGHLEDKRKRLLELRDQIKEAHAVLKDHKARYAAQVGEAQREVESAQAEIADGKRQIAAERRRLKSLLKRMRQRFRRHWLAEREAIARREAEAARQVQEAEQARLRNEQELGRLIQSRLRLNGDVELARRQLKDEWARLRQEELSYDEYQACRSAELDGLRKEIDQREAALAEVEEELDEQRLDWQEVRQELEREVDGLEARARNYRRQIADLDTELARLRASVSGEAPPAEVPPALPSAAVPEALAEPVAIPESTQLVQLERIAGELADQRAHLAEQWQRLLLVQQRWQQHYQSLVRELESAGRQLVDRELRIVGRERGLESAEERLRLRQQEALNLQRQLEAWQSRMTARETAWAGERDRLLAELHARQKLAERRLAEVRGLHDRWTKRRRRELAWLQAERATCTKLRQECADLRDDWLQRGVSLHEEQRSLAERSLALEQYQQEILGQAANPATAERRLQRLRVRWAAHLADSHKQHQAEQRKLEASAAELQEQLKSYQKQLARLNQREEELGERLRKWEEERLLAGDQMDQLRRELEMTRAHRDRYETQVTELRDEVERIARLLIEETPATLALPLERSEQEQDPPAQAA